MTQEQAIQRGFTHFIEVWRDKTDKEGVNTSEWYQHNPETIRLLDYSINYTPSCHNLYTVAIFLIKPKQ